MLIYQCMRTFNVLTTGQFPSTEEFHVSHLLLLLNNGFKGKSRNPSIDLLSEVFFCLNDPLFKIANNLFPELPTT